MPSGLLVSAAITSEVCIELPWPLNGVNNPGEKPWLTKLSLGPNLWLGVRQKVLSQWEDAYSSFQHKVTWWG